MPALFVGHGSPMNAIEDNTWSRGFQALGQALPEPTAILSISAHWYGPGISVTANPQPRTIHDFGGFPAPLYGVEYPAPGDAELAQRIVTRLAQATGARANTRLDWGLDHGTWSVLVHMRPKADLPVLQLSIDSALSPAQHLALGRALRPLRDEGVLVMGSGNATHNLRAAFASFGSGDRSTPAWARAFDADVMHAAKQHDGEGLARALSSDAGRLSHPTADHFLPILYVLGASHPEDHASFPIVGFDLGSLSMRSILMG